MRRGLRRARSGARSAVIETTCGAASPMRRGLRQNLLATKRRIVRGGAASPMRRGLRHRGQIRDRYRRECGGAASPMRRGLRQNFGCSVGGCSSSRRRRLPDEKGIETYTKTDTRLPFDPGGAASPMRRGLRRNRAPPIGNGDHYGGAASPMRRGLRPRLVSATCGTLIGAAPPPR